jgi:hypothetical protein
VTAASHATPPVLPKRRKSAKFRDASGFIWGIPT